MKQYVLLAGGLGNQLFQYAAALELGASEVVFLDLMGNKRVSKTKKPDICDLQLPIPVSSELFPDLSPILQKYFAFTLGSTARPSTFRFRMTKSKILLSITSGIVFWITGHKCKIILEKRSEQFITQNYSEKSHLLIGYFQSLNSCKRFSEDIELLKPVHLSIEVASFASRLRSQSSIGVHIRRGDYIGHKSFGVLSADYFTEILKSRINFESRVTIFSDGEINAFEFLPPEMIKSFGVCSRDFSAAEILYLMSNCHALILSNSSFSWWAGLIVQNRGGEVFSPFPWFKSEIQAENFYPRKWTRISSKFHPY
jgi:hypothetical protein